LRYLEHYEFRLVWESLTERTALLNKAPHIVHPMRFVLPVASGMRPAWMIAMGMFLYDHMGTQDVRLPGSRRMKLRSAPEGVPLSDGAEDGFVYSDCTVDDARLVMANALGAAEKGAEILTRTAFMSAKRDGGVWCATLRDTLSGIEKTICARAIVNAAGPWVMDVANAVHGAQRRNDVRLVKGSHIVVKRLYEGNQAYILQNDDGRVVFVIPYLDRFTMIGTTEQDMAAPPPFEGQESERKFDITEAETAYLCRAVNRHFKAHIAPADALWTFAGARPLFQDNAASSSTATREYVLDVQDENGALPLLSVFGGKLTTYRRLAEKVLKRLRPYMTHMGAEWTLNAPLPGGDWPGAQGRGPQARMDEVLGQIGRDYPWADGALLKSLVSRHGARTALVLGDTKGPDDLGQDFGHGLTACEVDYFIAHEWARTAEDILWRRTKLGLDFDAAQGEALRRYVAYDQGPK
jgi:glycerol-3-phosphate dehydrogenase